MEQKFERIAPGLYRRSYRTATGETSALYYGRLKRKSDGRRMLFALGSDLGDAKNDWALIKAKNRKGENLEEFKPQRRPSEANAGPKTVEEWSKIYLAKEEVAKLKSHDRDLAFAKHINGFFGKLLLTQIYYECFEPFASVLEQMTSLEETLSHQQNTFRKAK